MKKAKEDETKKSKLEAWDKKRHPSVVVKNVLAAVGVHTPEVLVHEYLLENTHGKIQRGSKALQVIEDSFGPVIKDGFRIVLEKGIIGPNFGEILSKVTGVPQVCFDELHPVWSEGRANIMSK